MANKIPTYNGKRLLGFNTTLPFEEPRWMIVWDETGWTCPCRRVIVCFDGKFVDIDGNSWDYGSELPSIGKADISWKAVPMETIKKFYSGVVPPWFPGTLKSWYEDCYLKGLKYL
jgi:hypothetical protein